jgi:hypothetical protein
LRSSEGEQSKEGSDQVECKLVWISVDRVMTAWISLPGLIGGVLLRRASTAALNIKYTGSIDVLEDDGAVK